MIDKTAAKFQSTADRLGVPIRLPRISRTRRKVTAFTNAIVGLALLVVGAGLSSKSLIALGALGVASAGMLFNSCAEK